MFHLFFNVLQLPLLLTSVSILNETSRAIVTAAASWSNPAIKSYSMRKKEAA